MFWQERGRRTARECEPVPGQDDATVVLVERHYPEVFAKFTSLGPTLEKLGNGGKAITWDTEHEVELLGQLNGSVLNGTSTGRPKIDTGIDACKTILMLAPKTNGEVELKDPGRPQFGHADQHEAHPHDRRLRAARLFEAARALAIREVLRQQAHGLGRVGAPEPDEAGRLGGGGAR